MAKTQFLKTGFLPEIAAALRRGLGRRIVSLLFVLGIVPLGILTLIFVLFYIEAQIQGIHRVQKELADGIASEITAYLSKMEGQVQLFARMLDMESRRLDELKPSADRLLEIGHEYDTVTIADLDGKEQCKMSRYYTFRAFELGSIAPNESFKAAVRGEKVIGQVVMSEFSKFPQVHITVPLVDVKERITGVLDVGVNINKIWNLISKHRIGENRLAYIVDSKGSLIAYEEISSVLQRRDLRHIGGVEAFLAGHPGVSRYVGLQGDYVVGAGAAIPLTGWAVFVEQPVKDAFSDLYTLSAVILLISLVTIVSAVFLGLRFSFQQIIRPIQRLQDEAHALAKGQLHTSIQMDRPDEIGQLATAFNDMVEDLKKTTVSRDLLVQEIDERKRAEEEKEGLQDRLRRAEKMEAIGMLAGGVAHDLNNILSGLVSYPELLLMDLPQDSPLRDPVLTIQTSGKRAAAIVQDMLTLARRGVAVTEVVSMNDVVCEYLASPEYKKLMEFHPHVQVQTHLDADSLHTMGSPVHLSKTVMNLVSNAAEALPNGGRVVISTRNQYVDKPIRGYDEVAEGDYTVLTVTDNGMGIASADLDKIFEPFYTKKIMGRSGTGLGMAVVWGTVKDHKGYIDVCSTEGNGTTFELFFPVTREELRKAPAPLAPSEYMGRGEYILVVDDVEEQRKIAAMLLTKLGYSVHVVAGGEEAVSYMESHRCDLLILDMIMEPGMDGLDTYRKVLEKHPGQKAIIASGFSETQRVKEAQRLGAGTYVRKPYTLEKIGLAVQKELRL